MDQIFHQNMYYWFFSEHLGHAWLNPKKSTWSNCNFHPWTLNYIQKRNSIRQIIFVIWTLKKYFHIQLERNIPKTCSFSIKTTMLDHVYPKIAHHMVFHTGESPPPAKNLFFSPLCKTSDSPAPNTPYNYLENPVLGNSNKFLLKKSATETQCNRIENHWTSKIYEI